MAVTANIAYALSRESGVGLEICKMALEKTHQDLNAAKKLLERWNNVHKTASNYGATCAYFDKDFNAAAVVSVKCTDKTLSTSREFFELVGGVAAEIVEYEQIHLMTSVIQDLEQKHDCKISISHSRFEKTKPFSLLTTYTHKDSIGVIVETSVENEEAFNHKSFKLFSFDCALHITAFEPYSVEIIEPPRDLKHDLTVQIEKELIQNGKSIQMWPDIINGKIKKWSEQNALLNQNFIKNNKETVEVYKKKIEEKINSKIVIERFTRFNTGS